MAAQIGATPDAAQGIILSAALALFKELGAKGAAYNHQVVFTFQNVWNANYPVAFPATSPQFARLNLRAVTADGVYGPATSKPLAALLPTNLAIPLNATSFPNWWRINSVTISGNFNGNLSRVLQTAAQQNVPDTTGSSDRATDAVDSSQAPGAAAINAGRSSLPGQVPTSPLNTATGGAGGAVTQLPAERVTGQVVSVNKTPWAWIAIGLGVVSAGGIFMYFALRKKGRKGPIG